MQNQQAIQKADKRAIGTVPWGNLFSNVESVGRDINAVMNKAGLDYTFHKEQLQLPNGTPVNNWAVVRDDTGAILSNSVGSDWTGLPNTKRFEWFSPFLMSQDATIIWAGEIQDSMRNKVCVIARLDKNTNMEIQKGDEVAKYVLLSDSYGGAALRPMLLAIRLMCGNGMMTATYEHAVKIRHGKAISVNLDKVHNDIALWNKGFEEDMENYKQLAAVDIKSKANLNNYFMDVMDFKIKEGETKLPTRQENTMERLRTLFEDTQHNQGKSLWSAYNAVTAYVNHESGRQNMTALNSLFYGQGLVKQRDALQIALDYVGKI